MSESRVYDFLTLIGLSSLIAAIVSGIINIIKDYLIEGFRFRREKKVNFLKKQINAYFRLFYTLHRISLFHAHGSFIMSVEDCISSMNEMILEETSLFNFNTLKNWYRLMNDIGEMLKKHNKSEEIQEDFLQIFKLIGDLMKDIKKLLNIEIIPEYRKITGTDMPEL